MTEDIRKIARENSKKYIKNRMIKTEYEFYNNDDEFIEIPLDEKNVLVFAKGSGVLVDAEDVDIVDINAVEDYFNNISTHLVEEAVMIQQQSLRKRYDKMFKYVTYALAGIFILLLIIMYQVHSLSKVVEAAQAVQTMTNTVTQTITTTTVTNPLQQIITSTATP